MLRRTTSKSPIVGWRKSCIRTSTPATSGPRNRLRKFRRPTICLETRTSARDSIVAGFSDFAADNDILSQIFGGAGRANIRMRGSDVHYRLELDFDDAINGGK